MGVPAEELWVDVGGAPIFVRRWGAADARPLLYWHGVGYASRGSMALNEAGPLLARDHRLRVLALDAPGFGRSPATRPEGYHPHALVDLVPPLLDALSVDRAPFMGFSWGADLGCHLAARHPERVSALVLLDAGYSDPPFDTTTPYEERVAHSEQAWRDRCAPSWDAVVARARADHRRWNAAIEAGCRAGWREEDGRLVPAVPAWIVAAAQHGIAHAPPSATRTRIAGSRLPVLLVSSDDAGEDDLARFASDLPDARILRAEGTGHDVLVDGGAEVVGAIGAWLEANGRWDG